VKRKYGFLALLFVFVFASASAAAADIALPKPREHAMTLFEALKRRASAPGGDFPTAPLSPEDLSDILWATSGLNRWKGWTVPMAQGLPPYVDVYAALENGVFLYDWKDHALREVAENDIRGKIGVQRFVASAPCGLILVGNAESLKVVKNETARREFAYVAAGAMTQDAYLAAAALGLGARYIHSMKPDDIRSGLKLPEGDFPICLMLLGK
jgi:hypothetical protein